MRLSHVPNVITALRMLLVVPIAIALLHQELITTMALFALAAVSDAADGFLARRFGWQSAVGAVLDPAADKLLLATVFVALAVLRLVPLWLMASAVARDLIIVLGAIAYRLWFGPMKLRPSAASKLNTLCQAMFILSVIGREQLAFPPGWWISALGALTFVTIVVSGIDYILRYGGAALREAKSRHSPLHPGGSRLT